MLGVMPGAAFWHSAALRRLTRPRPRGGRHIIGQYYQFLRLGFSGYRRIIHSCATVAEHLAEKIEATGSFDIASARRPRLPDCPARLPGTLTQNWPERLGRSGRSTFYRLPYCPCLAPAPGLHTQILSKCTQHLAALHAGQL